MNQLLSQKQLSEAIGVSPLTLIEWRKAGIITPKIHEKHVIRYDLTEVQSILAERAKKKTEL
jgi:predicted site-specific integrase-resolvase